jgi:hypothetical protein
MQILLSLQLKVTVKPELMTIFEYRPHVYNDHHYETPLKTFFKLMTFEKDQSLFSGDICTQV